MGLRGSKFRLVRKMNVTISYHTVDGEISSVAYHPYNQSVAMLTDALGSVVRTQDDYGEANFRYYGYGGLMKTTPGYLTPYIGWVGSLGYRETNLNHAEQYVRARHYSTTEARWTSVDPLWPKEPYYGYCLSNPTYYTDGTGKSRSGDYFNCMHRLQGKVPSYEACLKCKQMSGAHVICQRPSQLPRPSPPWYSGVVNFFCSIFPQYAPPDKPRPGRPNGPSNLCRTICETLICQTTGPLQTACVDACVKAASCDNLTPGYPNLNAVFGRATVSVVKHKLA